MSTSPETPPSQDGPRVAPDGSRGAELPLLVFTIGSRRFALPVCVSSDVREPGPLRTVPGAPRSVLGLAEWRGRVVTVLDPAPLLGEPAGSGRPCLVRLAPPFDHVAIRVSFPLRVETSASSSGGDAAESRCGESEQPPGAPVILDPRALVELADAAGEALDSPCGGARPPDSPPPAR